MTIAHDTFAQHVQGGSNTNTVTGITTTLAPGKIIAFGWDNTGGPTGPPTGAGLTFSARAGSPYTNTHAGALNWAYAADYTTNLSSASITINLTSNVSSWMGIIAIGGAKLGASFFDPNVPTPGTTDAFATSTTITTTSPTNDYIMIFDTGANGGTLPPSGFTQLYNSAGADGVGEMVFYQIGPAGTYSSGVPLDNSFWTTYIDAIAQASAVAAATGFVQYET